MSVLGRVHFIFVTLPKTVKNIRESTSSSTKFPHIDLSSDNWACSSLLLHTRFLADASDLLRAQGQLGSPARQFGLILWGFDTAARACHLVTIAKRQNLAEQQLRVWSADIPWGITVDCWRKSQLQCKNVRCVCVDATVIQPSLYQPPAKNPTANSQTY